MKKGALLLVLLVSIITLSGCSLQSAQETLDNVLQWVMHKDQANEQGFTVTKELLDQHFDKKTGYLDLSKLGLTAIPEVCALMDPADLTIIEFLSLAQNKIRLVDQDLSCLTNLRVLNLSYNDIVEVVRLGSLPKLQELLLHKNELEQAEDVAQLDLPALQKLNLAYNNLKELANFEQFKNLTVLELQHNALESIVGVENLEKLQQLKVEFNNLTDIPFLDQLKSLQSLTTEGNTLKESIATKAKELQDAFNTMKNTVPTGNSQ